jgi:AcrR family transcriptional regulator
MAQYQPSVFSKKPDVLWTGHNYGENQFMKKKVSDRRINRTRKSLQDALVELILEQGYEKITVQDVIERANVGRSTFYAHFQDIDDLLLSHFDLIQEQLDQEALDAQDAPAQNPWNLTLLLFQHGQKQRKLYTALMGGERGSNLILERIDRFFLTLIKEHLLLQFSNTDQIKLPLDVLTHYIVNSLASLLIWWLTHDLSYSAEQMNNMFWELIEHGVETIFEPVVAMPA